MKPRSIILIILLAIVPMLLLLWAGLRIAADEQRVVQDRFRVLMEEQLRNVNENIADFFATTERQLDLLTQIDQVNVESIRETIWRDPQVLQIFVMSQQGQLIYPDPTQSLNASEQSFLVSTGKMFSGKDLREAVLLMENQSDSTLSQPYAPGIQSTTTSTPQQATQAYQSQRSPSQLVPSQPVPNQSSVESRPGAKGWFVWYWDRGLNLIYWQRRPSGLIVGVALERGRWLADLITQLPNTLTSVEVSEAQIASPTSRMRLVNASSEVVYQWGRLEVSENSRPFCEIPVASPLQSWRLQCFVPESVRAGKGSTFLALVAGLAAVAIAIILMAWVLFRDYAASMREAAQQVSFVNQVSHELKTPLTNIRLYAELLEKDLADSPSELSSLPMNRVQVIVSESERLSRLIGNVLTLARQRKHSLKPNPRSISPDEWIEQTIDRFRPSLQELSLELSLDLNAKVPMNLDPDFLGQILENLISNVEKYAAEGGSIRIQSSQSPSMLQLSVQDAGPGIPASKWREVFRPFSRLSNSVSASAGTGIGLSIARELARQHGGDIVLMPCPVGCHFSVTLRAELNPTP